MTAPPITPPALDHLPCPFAGVFSEEVSATVGFGATKRRTVTKKLWFVERTENGDTTMRPVNKNLVPTGNAVPTTPEDVLRDFVPEPDMFMSQVAPRMRELEQTVDVADDHREKGELYSAEFQYVQALEVDEDHIRANFGIGLTYLEQGELDKSRSTLEKIVSLDAAFTEAHKHLFNEFGIRLRRNGMFRECIAYYTRAMELGENDDHLLFNVARAHYEAQDIDKAMIAIEECLRLNPALGEARLLRKALLRLRPDKDSSIVISGI
ncbi:tetratricopeptide (TPR) repeat protein [Desulfobaculum xiamenense]|uniref:Tetratricopeptide (TPR) repeat protein n=1 Tax=Desulfobaculum xiamenense TaxID=995050 RepID=A0A846QL91_9BACT|nr:tetratricopeptide repeat protein [Desulfobaculum xiamenense]NJB67820.1 tetratricopeptide (TPR) repeat protein [Desulfobaculum xiamenense]